MMDPLLASWRLYRAEGIGPRRVHRLLERFGSLDALLGDPVPDDVDRRGVERVRRATEAEKRGDAREVASWRERWNVVSMFDGDEYPEALRQLDDPPLMLFQAGRAVTALPRPRVVLVGARRASAYGRQVAGGFAGELARAGAAVGSGLARGIDEAAHRGALDVGGTTWAVVATGLDEVYPPEHATLAEAIRERGSVITEFPPGTEIQTHAFPARNRILAALADVVVVVEGRRRSGSLITADIALDLGREVMAVPGRVGDPGSEAPLMLIGRGAAPAVDAEAVLEAAGWSYHAKVAAPSLPEVPEALRHLLGAVPPTGALHVDEIAATMATSVPDALAGLLELELGGWVEALPGKYYARSVPRKRSQWASLS